MTVREPNNSSRVEREILEILEKADASDTPIDKVSRNLRRRPPVVRPNRSIPQHLSGKLTPEVIKIVASLVLAFLAAAVTGASHLLGLVFAIASLIVLFSLWIPSRSAGFGERPRWRGRDLGENFRTRNGPRQPQR